MSDWPEVTLGDLCAINPRLQRSNCPEDEVLVSFVPMAAVDEFEGAIKEADARPYRSVAKGFTYFRDGDVLFAKITPCMENGKAALADGLIGGVGFGSTEFHVLRPDGRLDRRFLYHLIRQPEFRRRAKASFTGTAGQQRVPTAFLESFAIRLPTLAEQHRIVDILDRAATIRRLRQQAHDTTRQIIPALYTRIFGDPAINPMGWPVRPLGDIGTLERGRSRHRPRNDPALLGGPYPLVQTGDVAAADWTITRYKSTYSELGLKQSRLWPAGTLCITIAANIANSGILSFDACFPDSVVGFAPGRSVLIPFVKASLDFMRSGIERLAPQLAQKNINLEILSRVPIPVPPLEFQLAFAQHVDRVIKINQRATASSQVFEAAAQSVQACVLG